MGGESGMGGAAVPQASIAGAPKSNPMPPPTNAGLGGLAQAFMGNQATQGAGMPQIMQPPQRPMPGASLPQIMQPSQSAMPDIAAMLAARRPAVQPIPSAPPPAPPVQSQARGDFLGKVYASKGQALRDRRLERRNNAGSR